jgi:hypothetical protein
VTGCWHRLGRLPLDAAAAPWAATHAALPVIERISDGVWNVYLSLRDGEGRARIGRTSLTLDPAPQLGPLEADPVLDLGLLGAFDDSGVTSSCLVASGDRRYLFYTGWSRGVTVPFYLNAGLAISERNEPFRRATLAPLFDRSAVDPFLTASPWVIIDEGRWRMWYVSGTGWTAAADGARHAYHIRYAESADGHTWTREGHVCLDYVSPAEYAFARPFVLRDGSVYRMWYAVRGDRYRIGYAESDDGCRWQRLDDERGLGRGDEPWEDEMVEYPCVFDWRGSRYMLYNGNGYGKTGVGLALWATAATDSPR